MSGYLLTSHCHGPVKCQSGELFAHPHVLGIHRRVLPSIPSHSLVLGEALLVERGLLCFLCVFHCPTLLPYLIPRAVKR